MIMTSHLVGETAAVATSALWTICSIFFASAARRIGALGVNAYRIAMAVAMLGIAHLIVYGTVVPRADSSQWFYLGLSGVMGLALGDFGYFGMLALIGPRRGLIMTALVPIFSSVTAYYLLGETLAAWDMVGIGVTLCGVSLVILEREDHSSTYYVPRKQKIYGYLCGFGGALGQGLGLVVSKYGMLVAGGQGTPPLNPLSTTFLRMIVAAAFVWIAVAGFGKLPVVLARRKETGAIKRTFAGAVTGPFVGVWLSMVAVTYAVAGVASTLMSLMPVMVIPLVWILFKEKTGWRGILGAAIAVAGVAVLFLV
jgi:drug/metabolite transporter (DMT)-like permease